VAIWPRARRGKAKTPVAAKRAGSSHVALLSLFARGLSEIAPDQLKMVASRLMDFMQACTGLITKSVPLLAVEMLKVQYDRCKPSE
jgi:hypothetical protein